MPEEHEISLTEAQIDLIAERAANRALEKVYAEIGQSIVQKALYVIGAGALALAFWLNSKGFFHK